MLTLWAFVRRSRRTASPILDLRLFHNRVFRTANVATLFFGAAFMAVTIFLPLFLVNVLGVSATRAGAALIPFSLGIVAGATTAGQLVSRVGYRPQLLAGAVAFLFAVLGLALMESSVAYRTVTLYMIIAGLGMGPAMPLFTLAIQNAVDVRFVGQATSASQFFRQIGATIGAAVMGALLATTLSGAFATLDVPAGLVAAAGSSTRELVSSGGAELPDRVRDFYGTLAAEADRAIDAHDGDALSRLAEEPDVPAGVRARLAVAAAALPGLDASESTRLAAEIVLAVQAHGEGVARALSTEVRGAFALATSRIYALTSLLIVLAIVFTARVPELPLRSTHDRAEAAR
jgi:MFS family permease